MRRAAALTITLLYLVVLAGAVVRATGSGMGCPDWPKCFGRLIPPTDKSQIPEQFRERFETEGHGNLVHTWIEYLNRQLGVLSGFAMLATTVLAFRHRQAHPRLPWMLLAAMLLYGFVAWMGKVVVDSVLDPRTVTFHMAGGLLLVCAAVAAYARRVSRDAPLALPRSLRSHIAVALGMVVLQIALGSQVRETVDRLSDGGCCGDGKIVDQLGGWYLVHRLGAFLTVAAAGLLFFRLRANGVHRAHPWLVRLTGAILVMEYGIGVLLAWFNLPALLQPAHLVLATGLLGVLVALLAGSRNAAEADGGLKNAADAANMPAP